MWIESVDVRGFRGLAGEFEFSPGLTLVIGDNEAGKSSLHDALIRTFFGFSKTERRRSRGTSPLERRAPWGGGPYGLVARLRDGDRVYRVEWDFASHRARLVDELGTDLTHELEHGRDEVGLGERFLGIGIDDFRQVCCIDQDQLMAVRHSPTLGVALQEAVATAGGGVPVEHAVDRLNDFLRSIGARTDNLRPSPAGRLAALGRERDQILADLSAAEQAREEIEALARDAAKARDDVVTLESERERVRQQLLAAEVEDLGQRSREARRLEQQSRDLPEGAAGATPDVVEEARRAQERRDEIGGELESVERQVESASERVEELETEQRALRTSADGLELYARVDTSARDEVRESWAQYTLLTPDATSMATEIDFKSGNAPDEADSKLRDEVRRLPAQEAGDEVRHARLRVHELAEELVSSRHEDETSGAQVEKLEGMERELTAAVDGLGPYAQIDASARDEVRERWAQFDVLASRSEQKDVSRFEADPDLARYRNERDDLHALAVVKRNTSAGLRRWLPTAPVVVGMAIAWLVSPWVGVALVAVGIVWFTWQVGTRERRVGGAPTLAERLESHGGASLEDLDARVAEEDRRKLQADAAAEAVRVARAEAEERRGALAAEIGELLDRVAAPPSELEQRVSAYLTAVERHEELREQEARLASVERELEQARRPSREHRRLVQEHERAVVRLRDAYAAVEVEEDDLERAAEAFELLVREGERSRKRLQEADAAAEAVRVARAEAEERRGALAAEIGELLDRVAAPPSELEQRVSAYLTAVERHEELREQEARLASVERELEQARRPSREHRRLVQEHERAVVRLRDAYAAVEVEEDDLERAAEAFELLVREGERSRKRLQEADAAAEALRSLLAGASLESLVARAAESKRRYDEHVQLFGALERAGAEDAKQLATRLTALDGDLRTKHGEFSALEARIADREEQAGDPAALKELVAAIDAQIDRLDEAKAAVALARTVLEEAADELRREFAPHLNEALERNLGRITGGRYASAIVNGELDVLVEVTGGELKPADELSRATKDQLFLVERLEIARLLAPTKGSAPLLLDDPFAHYDPTRLRRGLELLSEVAEERQVVVFSEDSELAAAARALCPRCAVIELPAPV